MLGILRNSVTLRRYRFSAACANTTPIPSLRHLSRYLTGAARYGAEFYIESTNTRKSKNALLLKLNEIQYGLLAILKSLSFTGAKDSRPMPDQHRTCQSTEII